MNEKKIKNLGTVIALCLIIILFVVLVVGYYKKCTMKVINPIVTMEVENFGTIKMELYPDIAPETVANFVTLANNGFYNNLTFHRVVKDFMIQGGDKAGDGTGSPTFADLYNDEDESKKYTFSDGTEAKATDSYSIKGEFVANKHNENTLNLTAGTVAMARNDFTSYSATLTKESYNSAGSQFFIMTTDEHTNLSGYYAGFGKVIEGMDVVSEIANVECKSATEETDSNEEQNTETKEISKPVQDVVITSVTVDTQGVNYDIPHTIKPFDYMKWLYSLYGLPYNQ